MVEVRLFDLATQVELAAFDEPDFHDQLQRARDRGVWSAWQLVNNVINFVTAFAGIAAAVTVVGLLNPVLLVVVLLAQAPGAWAAVRSARIRYVTRFALVDSYRRKYILADLIAERRTAAELRSFTMRSFLLARVSQLAGYVRRAELAAARRETTTRVLASAMGGVATAGVYASLGVLLATGTLPLSVAGTAVLAIRSAHGSLQQLMFAVNQCYEDGLYFSDYLAFCEDALSRLPPAGSAAVPPEFSRIEVRGVTFSYPGAEEPSAAGRVRRDQARRGGGARGGERVGQDDPRQGARRAVPAVVGVRALGFGLARRRRRRAAAGADRGDRAGPRQLAADRAAEHHDGPAA